MSKYAIDYKEIMSDKAKKKSTRSTAKKADNSNSKSKGEAISLPDVKISPKHSKAPFKNKSAARRSWDQAQESFDHRDKPKKKTAPFAKSGEKKAKSKTGGTTSRPHVYVDKKTNRYVAPMKGGNHKNVSDNPMHIINKTVDFGEVDISIKDRDWGSGKKDNTKSKKETSGSEKKKPLYAYLKEGSKHKEALDYTKHSTPAPKKKPVVRRKKKATTPKKSDYAENYNRQHNDSWQEGLA